MPASYIEDRDGNHIYQVMFLTTWPDVPVFHRFRTFEGASGQSGGWTVVMVCGRAARDIAVTYVAYKHARRFGRPCKGCFG